MSYLLSYCRDAHLAFSLEELALNDNPVGALGVAALLQVPLNKAVSNMHTSPLPNCLHLTAGDSTCPTSAFDRRHSLNRPHPPVQAASPPSVDATAHYRYAPTTTATAHPPNTSPWEVHHYLGPDAVVRTGGAALRRLGLANARVGLASLHDLAAYLEATVRVAVTLEGSPIRVSSCISLYRIL